MRCLAFILLLLSWAQGVCAQIIDDSDDMVEQEDSMKLLTIKPIRKPKKLVKQIMERLQDDLKQKHGARKYKIEGTYRFDPLPPFSASCIYPVKSDNGLEIQHGNTIEDFCYEGTREISSSDSSFIKGELVRNIYFSPAHPSHFYGSGGYPPAPFVYYDETIRWYKIKAFKITYGTYSVYRIHLDKKKDRKLYRSNDRELWFGDSSDTVYFDCNTLLIKEFKGDFRRESSIPWKYEHFHAEYDEEEGSPILKRITHVRKNDRLERKAVVRRIM